MGFFCRFSYGNEGGVVDECQRQFVGVALRYVDEVSVVYDVDDHRKWVSLSDPIGDQDPFRHVTVEDESGFSVC